MGLFTQRTAFVRQIVFVFKNVINGMFLALLILSLQSFNSCIHQENDESLITNSPPNLDRFLAKESRFFSLKATTIEVTKYEKVVYRNAYDNLDLEISLNTEGGIHVELEEKIKGAASKINMKPRLISSEYNTSQRSIALAKSNKILKIKSNNDKIDFVGGNGFKSQRPEQYSDNKSFDITLK